MLGRQPGTQAFRELDEHPGDETFPGITVLRLDSGLFFATAEALDDRVRAVIRDSEPRAARARPRPRRRRLRRLSGSGEAGRAPRRRRAPTASRCGWPGSSRRSWPSSTPTGWWQRSAPTASTETSIRQSRRSSPRTTKGCPRPDILDSGRSVRPNMINSTDDDRLATGERKGSRCLPPPLRGRPSRGRSWR